MSDLDKAIEKIYLEKLSEAVLALRDHAEQYGYDIPVISDLDGKAHYRIAYKQAVNRAFEETAKELQASLIQCMDETDLDKAIMGILIKNDRRKINWTR